MIAAGTCVQAVGIGLFVVVEGFASWLLGAVLLGLGTALVYPTLLAVISDVAPPAWRGSAVGVYRLWRDGVYAVGALTAGLLSNAFGIPTTIAVRGGVTLLSGVVVADVMYETLRHPPLSTELNAHCQPQREFLISLPISGSGLDTPAVDCARVVG